MVVLFCLSLAPAKVYPLETLWKFKVPVLLNNMPSGVKYVVLHWWIVTEDLKFIYNDLKIVPLNLNEYGNAKITAFIDVYDIDIKTPEKARWFIVRLKLSDDGASVYEIDTKGETWTQSKENTKLVDWTAMDLKTLHKAPQGFDAKVTNPDWKKSNKPQLIKKQIPTWPPK